MVEETPFISTFYRARLAPRYSFKVKSQPGLSLSGLMSDASLGTASLCVAGGPMQVRSSYPEMYHHVISG